MPTLSVISYFRKVHLLMRVRFIKRVRHLKHGGSPEINKKASTPVHKSARTSLKHTRVDRQKTTRVTREMSRGYSGAGSFSR